MSKCNASIVRSLIIVLGLYFLIVAGWAWLQEDVLQECAISCGGLYGDYQQYYLPFPIITASVLSDIGGGPTRIRINVVMLLFDVLLPLMIGWTVFIRLKKQRLWRVNCSQRTEE